MTSVGNLYALRFGETGLDKRVHVWKLLCEHFFNYLIDPGHTVLDLACGYGEFINHVCCRDKIAVDVNPDAAAHLHSEVSFVCTPATDLQRIADSSIDTVFTSNFLEHLADKATCDTVFSEVWRILKPAGGQFIVLGPNIKYAYREYWDYFDHILPFSHLAIAEGLRQHGFHVVRNIDRFLPFTMNNRLPTPDIFIRAYLRMPLAWRFLGKQFLVIGSKP